LFVSVFVHEDERIQLPVKKLNLDFFHVRRIQRIAAFVGTVEHRTSDQVPQFALIQGVSLSRLDEIHFDHQVRFAVNLDL
jgi:hypothetical protein